MEGEKKRKRGENGEVKDRDRRKKEGETVRERSEDVAEVVPQEPSEEEVEEFFTILRRMHVAVKYFEKNGTSIADVNCDGLSNLKALEKTAAAVDGDEKKSMVIVNGVALDLNAIPEAES